MNLDIFYIWNQKIAKHTKICLLSGIIVGWITHFYMLTNKLPNWDDATNLSTVGSGDYLGRWFLKYIHPLGGGHSIPATNGFLMILFLSLAACLVLEILNLKSTTAAILVPALMVTFPSVACTMTFMFMAHTSGIAIFMICLAVFLLRKYRFGWIPCIVLLICSLGVYQPYISIGIVLMLMGMMSDLLNGKEYKEIFSKGVLCVIVLLITVGIYMILCNIVNPELENETYGGVANMGQIPIEDIPTLIGRCYKRFLEYFLWKPFAFMPKVMQICNICVCALACLLGSYLIFAKKLFACVWNGVLFCAVAFFMPLAVAFIYFMAPEVEYSMLMLYAYVFIYVTVIMLWENACKICKDIGKNTIKYNITQACSLVIAVTMMISCYSNYLVSNKAYFRMDLSKQRVASYFNRVLTNVENQSGYIAGDAVTILGEFNFRDNPNVVVETNFVDTEILREMSGVALENGLLTSGVRDDFIETYVGFKMADLTGAEKEDIMDTNEFKDMPLYPAEGSIQKINDIWVVKLCD